MGKYEAEETMRPAGDQLLNPTGGEEEGVWLWWHFGEVGLLGRNLEWTVCAGAFDRSGINAE